MRRIAALMAVIPVMTAAQQIGQNASPQDNLPATFTAGTQLVVEHVSVTDKRGRPVSGLTAKDFAITENGVPQTIRFFEEQKLPDAPLKPETPVKPRYQGRRLLVFYFDMTAMPPVDQLRALSAAKQFVRTQMSAADMVAIMRYQGGAVNVLQDFTDDRDRLLSIIETMIVGEGQGFDESTDDASASDTGAAFGQDDTEFNIFNTDRQLAALQTAAEMLGQLVEKKSL